jgi:EAL domain-containing protein (putative c-di-GMP-specific phosphodiesterase class I)
VIDLCLADALIHAVDLRECCPRLAAAGVRFCLNQYDPGPDVEVLLAQLPLNYLRLSSRYADMHGNPALNEQLQGIVSQAHGRHMQVIGQQIENPQAAATLWLSGVDFIQGNLVRSVGSELDFDDGAL